MLTLQQTHCFQSIYLMGLSFIQISINEKTCMCHFRSAIRNFNDTTLPHYSIFLLYMKNFSWQHTTKHKHYCRSSQLQSLGFCCFSMILELYIGYLPKQKFKRNKICHVHVIKARCTNTEKFHSSKEDCYQIQFSSKKRCGRKLYACWVNKHNNKLIDLGMENLKKFGFIWNTGQTIPTSFSCGTRKMDDTDLNN